MAENIRHGQRKVVKYSRGAIEPAPSHLLRDGWPPRPHGGSERSDRCAWYQCACGRTSMSTTLLRM